MTPACPKCYSTDTTYLYNNVYVCDSCNTEMDDKEEDGVIRYESTYFYYNTKTNEYEEGED